MREFKYLRPETVEEAVALREKYEGCSVLLNGGTDIVIQLRDHLISPEFVIDIKHVPGLKRLTFHKEEGLYIGACVTMNELGDDEDVRRYYPFLQEAAYSVGSKQVRNRATVVGNIVNASPLCDTGTPLYVCEAKVCIAGKDGEREVPISEFITFVRKTALHSDEVVVGIKVPYTEGAQGIFTKVSRRKEVDLSTICATVLKLKNTYRIAFGAVAPTPIRLMKTEDLLNANPMTSELIEEAAKLARTEVSPITDVRASKEYRYDVVEVTVRRSLEHFMQGGA